MARVIFRLVSRDPLYSISTVQKLDNYNIETIKMMKPLQNSEINGTLKDYKKEKI